MIGQIALSLILIFSIIAVIDIINFEIKRRKDDKTR